MKKRKKRWLILGAVAAALLIFCLSPLFPYACSLAVMKVYSGMNERESLMADTGLEVRMPGGGATKERDWYPFVMTFNDDRGFSRYCGQKSRLTILYNFGAFDLNQGASLLYNEESPYYSSFYGAYLVQQENGIFGFTSSGGVDPEQLQLVPRYDFFHLVLNDFGLQESDGQFTWQVTGQESNVTQAGLEGWTRLEADLEVSGASHNDQGFITSYLQYGRPGKDCSRPFAPVKMKGLIYARYFPEENVSVFLYALCAGPEALEQCDREILAKTVVERG